MNPKKQFLGSICASVATLLLGVSAAQADVRLPNLFSDNMVLQQGTHTPIWGWADEGEVVTVTFRGHTVKTTTKDGKWMVKLSKLKAGGPDTLTISGKNNFTLKNVLVGEVWLCSGQSNMEFPLKRSFEAEGDISTAANPMIHFFHVPKLKANEPTNDIPASWKECNSNTAPDMSAVGYYFIRDIQKARNVPVGLIESDWGGSPVEVWMSGQMLESNPEYKKDVVEHYNVAKKNHESAKAAYEKEKAEATRTGGKFSKKAPTLAWKPSELYNGMIAPLVPYSIKGALWYQGEANAGRAEQYRSLLPDLIRNWRKDWNEPFPFFVVQLAPYLAMKDQPSDSSWAELREAQLHTTQILPKVGMAVITDVGNPDNIHPTKKKPVGERLALSARGIAYSERIEYSGPVYSHLAIKNNEAIVSFDHVGRGLEARDGELKGFAICGEDKKFVWAKAEIDPKNGKKIIVSSPSVTKPVAVRYGWADCPVVNLWNKDGLPATPFRTDDFPMVTAGKR